MLGPLSDAVSPGGRVVGLDANASHVAAARQYASDLGLANVEVLAGDARHTGLPAGTFDLVHSRTVLVTVPEPAEVVAEMARLARPGGWVASQEADAGFALCHPPRPESDRLWSLFQASFVHSGADLRVGCQLPELFRAAGLAEVEPRCTQAAIR
jgi:ubiquinone/menaquinone biosynthesis C-methylase UbiE